MGSNARILLYFGVAAILLIVGITMRLPQILEGPAPQAASGINIGGPFTLRDHKGNEVTDRDILGTYSLIYFGYTYCPDICPTGLQTATLALESLPMRKSNKVVPLFITVDPTRDTPEVMANYVSHFHPNMVGLTGTEDQIASAATAYKVYYKKVEYDDAATNEDYLMDHSAFHYLMGPDGKYLTHFSHDVTSDEMAERLKAFVR